MVTYGEYYVLNKPTVKNIKRMKKKLAKQCVRTVKKLIRENMDDFFIVRTANEFDLLFGRHKQSLTIGWKIDFPTLQD